MDGRSVVVVEGKASSPASSSAAVARSVEVVEAKRWPGLDTWC